MRSPMRSGLISSSLAWPSAQTAPRSGVPTSTIDTTSPLSAHQTQDMQRPARRTGTRGRWLSAWTIQSLVSRVWAPLGLTLHKHVSGKLSKDPMCVPVVRDVVRLTSRDYVRHGTSSRRRDHVRRTNPHQHRHRPPTNQQLKTLIKPGPHPGVNPGHARGFHECRIRG
jgi:hypothetical protein